MSDLLEEIHRAGVILDYIGFYLGTLRWSAARGKFDGDDLKNVDRTIRAAEELLQNLKEIKKFIEEKTEEATNQ